MIKDFINRARLAQQELEAAGQEAADAAVRAAAWSLLKPENNQRLSEMAVATTGLGNVKDKVLKNHRKTLGLLRDMQGEQTIGVVGEDRERGMTDILRPMGVVAAITPSTNPVATPLNNIINALKAGNAIILAPSPKGMQVARALLDLIYAEFARAGLPLERANDLVQLLPKAERALTQELMQQADIVVVTGSQNNVRAGYRSGTPCLGVGAGNVTVIVDETADPAAAAGRIASSKIFDNATSCSSENSLVLLAANADKMLAALAAAGGLLLSPEDKARLQQVLWRDGVLNRELIAKDAAELLAAINQQRAAAGVENLAVLESVTFLLVQEDGVGRDYPYSGEKMSPVLTVYQAEDFAAAVDRAESLLNHQGRGHSVGLHSSDEARAIQLGLRLPACRVIVNQAHCFATGGAFNNGLPFSSVYGMRRLGRQFIFG